MDPSTPQRPRRHRRLPQLLSWLFFAASCSLCSISHAASPHKALPRTISLQHDNDVIFFVYSKEFNMLALSDRDYSSGLFLSCQNWGKLRDLGEAITHWLFGTQKSALYAFGLSLGQEIYTPLHVEVDDFVPFERPFAGWLYLQAHYTAILPKWRIFARLKLGFIGRYSFAEDVQRGFHALLRAINQETTDVKGWNYQLPHEPTLQLHLRAEWPLFQLLAKQEKHMQLLIGAELAAGNVLVHPELRLRWEFGWLPRRSNDTHITTFQTSPKPPTKATPRNWELRFYVEGFARAVFRNLFLDGSTFVESPRIERYPAVAGVIIGLDWRLHAFRLQVDVVIQTLDAPYALRFFQDHKYFRLQLSYELPYS